MCYAFVFVFTFYLNNVFYVLQLYDNGVLQIQFANGTDKFIFTDGSNVVKYINGDLKKV